jgi:hypothetical protein
MWGSDRQGPTDPWWFSSPTGARHGERCTRPIANKSRRLSSSSSRWRSSGPRRTTMRAWPFRLLPRPHRRSPPPPRRPRAQCPPPLRPRRHPPHLPPQSRRLPRPPRRQLLPRRCRHGKLQRTAGAKRGRALQHPGTKAERSRAGVDPGRWMLLAEPSARSVWRPGRWLGSPCRSALR